jgi:hypothetical protein
MKKSLLVAFGLIIASSFVFGQSELHFSPKVGVSFSNFSEELELEDDLDQEHQVGYTFGMDFRVYTGSFMFMPGLYYHALTTEMKRFDDVNNIDISDESTIHMMRVPLSLGWWVTGADHDGLLNIYLKGGFTPSIVAGVKEPDAFEFDRGDVNTFQFAWNAGVGVDIAIFTVELAYEGGFTKFYDGGNDKNNMWIITAGLAF